MKTKVSTFNPLNFTNLFFPCLLIFIVSCSNDLKQGEFSSKSFGNKKSYSMKSGDSGLFEENTNLSLSKKLSKVNNDKDLSEYFDDDSQNDDIEISDSNKLDDNNNSNKKKKHTKKSKKPKHWQKIAFENEPQISMSLLRQLTTCPVPKLNLTKPTITTNVEWQIFVYCVLDILPEEEHKRHKKGPKKHEEKHKISKHEYKDHDDYESSYPEIEDMRKYQSAYKFTKNSLKKYLKKYLFHNADLTNEQKFAMFERIFLVTKFRMLTQNEKAMVEDLIARKGLYYTSIIYRLNWYFSEFYQDHFDFSQDPQPEYESYEIYGKIVTENGKLVDNMKYSLPADGLYGFEISGISQTKTGIFYKIKKFFTQDHSQEYNFHLQFYLPDDINEVNNSEIEVPVFVEPNENYEAKFELIKLTGKIISNINIVLQAKPQLPPGEIPPEDPSQVWPDVDTIPNPHIESLSWGINFSGNLGDCQAPSVISNAELTIVDGYGWQDFITCYLKVNIADIAESKDYYPLMSKKSAFYLMFLVSA